MDSLADELILDICEYVYPELDISAVHFVERWPTNLLALSATCVRLRRICLPLLFRMVRIDRESLRYPSMLVTQANLLGNASIAHIVFSYSQGSTDPADPQVNPFHSLLQGVSTTLQSMPRVFKLCLQFRDFPRVLDESCTPAFKNCLSQIVDTVENLSQLSIVFGRTPLTIPWSSILQAFGSRAKKIHTLELRFERDLGASEDLSFLLMFKSVQRLTIDVPGTFRDDLWSEGFELAVSIMTELRELHFRSSRAMDFGEVAPFFTEASRHLDQLGHLRKFTFGTSTEILSDIDETNKTVTAELAEERIAFLEAVQREWVNTLSSQTPHLEIVQFGTTSFAQESGLHPMAKWRSPRLGVWKLMSNGFFERVIDSEEPYVFQVPAETSDESDSD